MGGGRGLNWSPEWREHLGASCQQASKQGWHGDAAFGLSGSSRRRRRRRSTADDSSTVHSPGGLSTDTTYFREQFWTPSTRRPINDGRRRIGPMRHSAMFHASFRRASPNDALPGLMFVWRVCTPVSFSVAAVIHGHRGLPADFFFWYLVGNAEPQPTGGRSRKLKMWVLHKLHEVPVCCNTML